MILSCKRFILKTILFTSFFKELDIVLVSNIIINESYSGVIHLGKRTLEHVSGISSSFSLLHEIEYFFMDGSVSSYLDEDLSD